ncbi:MAG: TolC family protein [Flavobacteriales bacterium]|nr:TolC family protein [Flavobacteriales bacterium]MCB9180752.1 TolC family protein [Flavobacteriales bacterium]MCB9200465.1 TolC family protein [Flavobacteriales bacterium]HOP44017.1 TolC family protein [Flavobacteriales bacterium]HPF68372.1 TolC family protein [Flavobacteriales bacterium]
MRNTTLILLLATGLGLNAQGPMTMSLQQAMDHAAQYSYSVRTNELEAEKARRKIKEVMAIGLPQIDASGGIQNYIDVPISVVPNFFGEGPEFLEAQFGVPWTLSGQVQLNQLIFDGSYLIGLQATKELKQQSDQELELAIRDARAAAAKAYYGVLAAEEGAEALRESVPVLERSLTEAQAMQETGFMEETDVDRIRIELANTRDQLMVFERQQVLALNLLRFYLGVPSGTPMELTDDLQELIDAPDERALVGQPMDMAGHVEHRIAESQVRLQTLNVRNEKAAYWPRLNGFLSHQQQAFGFNDVVETDWYPGTLWGVNLQVPIFSSGMRANKVKQADLTLQQVEVNKQRVEQQLALEEAQARSDVETAQALYDNQRDRLELARRVFERTSTKFTEGLSSSFELTTEQGNYLSQQQAYIQRLADLVNARTELRKTLDLF